MKLETTVCVLGAGPAGSCAALQLAKLGIDCIVVDKASFPRDKVCGDALSSKVLTQLKKIDENIAKRLQSSIFKKDSWGVTFIAPNNISLEIPYAPNYLEKKGDPGSFVCKRIDFDHFLFREMKMNPGIHVYESIDIVKQVRTENGYLLSNASGNFQVQAKMIIVANGAQSPFTKEIAGFKVEHKHYIAGIRAYYSGIKEIHDDNFIELHFLENVLPGYLWIFHLPNGEANVGIGMLSKSVARKKINLKKSLLDAVQNTPELKDRFANANLLGKIQGYGLPLGSKKRKLHGDHYVLTGDAGFLIDPFSGEGIGNAIYSARIAAITVAEAISRDDYSDNFLERYDREVYRVLWPELQLSHKLQKLARSSWLFNFLLRLGSKNKQVKALMISMFHEVNIRKKLASPMFYVKLLFNKS